MPTKRGRGIIYARPSFLEGMARVFDLGGTLNEYDFGPGGAESDAEALRSDWDAIGDDWRAALGDWEDWEATSDCGESEDAHGEEAVPAAHWEGDTLPPPNILKQYEDAVPGSAERIIRMWEAQAKHRMEMESRRI